MFLKAVNRAKPSSNEIFEVFDGRIADGALLLTDGLRSYNILETVADCSIKNVMDEKTSFYNLNTVNSLHSFIKEQYKFYRGVATKYINRYCVLFKYAFGSSNADIEYLKSLLLKDNFVKTYSIMDVKDINLAYL